MSKITDTREAVMVGRRSDGSLVRRPLSPHLQVYDMMQVTSALSITHRITGTAWSIGMVLLVWWLVAAAAGEDSFNGVQWFFGSFFGVVGLMALTAIAWYHTLAGLRHLYWDSGRGYDLPTTYMTGRAVLLGTAALTALTWLIMLISWI
jgi:succinate dehydrogenase / fumarate reductase cytochrome b subunit